MRTFIPVAITVVTGCGDNIPPGCPVSTTTSVPQGIFEQCRAARRFAGRDTVALVPAQDEVDRYFGRVIRAIDAEPALYGIEPQLYRTNGGVTLFTSNTAVIDAWTGIRGLVPPTNDTAFDALMSELAASGNAPSLEFDNDIGTEHYFALAGEFTVNEDVLNARLLPTSSHLPESFMRPQQDGTWRWTDSSATGTDEATAEIDFTAGWGDCFSGCAFFHFFRAVVPPGGSATVYDLGGDPPPFQLSPNTKPPP